MGASLIILLEKLRNVVFCNSVSVGAAVNRPRKQKQATNFQTHISVLKKKVMRET